MLGARGHRRAGRPRTRGLTRGLRSHREESREEASSLHLRIVRRGWGTECDARTLCRNSKWELGVDGLPRWHSW